MATTTNYGWTTPDDTALVKDGAAAIRSLGTSVDTTTKALNPSTTLGDIEYRSSTANTNTRLAVGTTGQVLTVAGGVPSWASAASSSANFTLLNSGGTALTGAGTITVSGISDKSSLWVQIVQASSASASSVFSLRLNTDSGSNYSYSGISADPGGSPAIFTENANLSPATSFLVGTMGDNALNVVNANLGIQGANATGIKTIQTFSMANGASTPRCVIAGGYYSGASVVSSVSIVSSIGNFDNGTIYVYGSAV
jgi:hypothetical protein